MDNSVYTNLVKSYTIDEVLQIIGELSRKINDYNNQLNNFENYIFYFDEDIILREIIVKRLDNEMKMLDYYNKMSIDIKSNLMFTY